MDVETSKNVLSFFMHPNSEVKFALPVGSFRIVYDAGKNGIMIYSILIQKKITQFRTLSIFLKKIRHTRFA